MLWLIMFHDKDRQVAINKNYELLKKELPFMITKTLFIRCYSNKCGVSWDSLQHNLMNYIIALTNNSLSQRNFKRTN